MDNISKENKNLKNDLANKDIEIKELQDSVNYFLKELKNPKKTNILNNIKEESKKSERTEEDDSINISLGDNLNIQVQNINNKQNNLKNNLNVIKPNSKLNLNFDKNKDFNEEFLENYDEFSPSWRKEADKMRQRKKGN